MVTLHAPVISSLGNPQDAGLYGQQTLRSFIIAVTQVQNSLQEQPQQRMTLVL